MCAQQSDGNRFHRMLRIESEFRFRTNNREGLKGWGDEHWRFARRNLSAVFSALALWVATTLYCNAATYWYVSNNGNDNSPGTNAAAPLQHIQTAVNRAAYGDTVNIQAGTYREQVE